MTRGIVQPRGSQARCGGLRTCSSYQPGTFISPSLTGPSQWRRARTREESIPGVKFDLRRDTRRPMVFCMTSLRIWLPALAGPLIVTVGLLGLHSAPFVFLFYHAILCLLVPALVALAFCGRDVCVVLARSIDAGMANQ